jgi:Trypsin-like peptidase domain
MSEETEKKFTSLPINSAPPVYLAVRAVGVITPRFQPRQGGLFADQLDIRGTAFWLKEYKKLVTCAHVVQDMAAKPIETGSLMVGNEGNYGRAIISSIDFDHDLAVLTMPETPEDLINAEASRGLEIADHYPQVGEEVGYAGFPLGLQLMNNIHSPTYAQGVIGVQTKQTKIRKEIQITGAVAGGFSGSPITLKNDPTKVIGVLSNGPQESANIFMAISWEHVKKLVELAIS